MIDKDVFVTVSGTGNLSVDLVPTGADFKAILVIIAGLASTDTVSAVNGDGSVTLLDVASSPQLSGTGEAANVHAFFAGASIPSGTVTINMTGTGAHILYAYGYTADGDCEVVDDDFINSDTPGTSPSVTLALAGRSCACAIGGNAGQNAPGSIAPLTNWTADNETDQGNWTSFSYSYDIVGTTDVTAGLTQTTDLDITAIAVAMAEIAAPAGGGRGGVVNGGLVNRRGGLVGGGLVA